MPRPDRSAERRREFAPILARAFADLGYRRATTAELAARCGLQEKALYRLWPDKRAMFLAALDQVFTESEIAWSKAAAGAGPGSVAERLLVYEGQHHGEHRLYRIVFAGLSETDDPLIRQALGEMYARFHRLIQTRIEEHRKGLDHSSCAVAALAAWAIIGLGTVAAIGRELEVLTAKDRRRLLSDVGRHLLGRHRELEP